MAKDKKNDQKAKVIIKSFQFYLYSTSHWVPDKICLYMHNFLSLTKIN